MDKEDIAANFEIDIKELDDKEILLAFYNYECYEGDAFILYKQNEKLYEVNAGHCSCYGLEGQWSPEETSIEFLKTRNFSYAKYEIEVKNFLATYMGDEK